MDWNTVRRHLDRIGTVLGLIWFGFMLAYVWWWWPWTTSLVVIALLVTYAVGTWRANRESWSIARAVRRHPDALDIARRATEARLPELAGQMREAVRYDGRDYYFEPWLPLRDRFITTTIMPALSPQARAEATGVHMPLFKALAGVVDDLVTAAFWRGPGS